MSQIKLSAFLMIMGFLFLVSGGIAAPPGVYREKQLEGQLKIISDYQSRWSATGILGALGVLSSSAGFILLGLHHWENQNKALLLLGTVGVVISGAVIALQSYRRVTDPAVQLASESSLDQIGFYALLLGIFFFGFVFLQAGYPSWLGYLSIGSTVLLGLGAAFGSLAIAEVAYIIPLIVAIVLLRSG